MGDLSTSSREIQKIRRGFAVLKLMIVSMRMGTAARIALIVALGAAAIEGCTGDDPPFQAPPADAGNVAVDAGGSTDAGSTDSAPPPNLARRIITAISAGYETACALVDEGAKKGQLYCWGGNPSLLLGASPPNSITCQYPGTGGYACSPKPVLVDPGPVTAVSVGQNFACLIKEGKVRCWGDNGSGQLGGVPATETCHTLAASTTLQQDAGTRNCHSQPDTPLAIDGEVVEISTATMSQHACAKTADGKVYCWGANATAEVSSPESATITTPKLVMTGASHISAGGFFIPPDTGFTCGVEADGGLVRCWGYVKGFGASPDAVPCNDAGACLKRTIAKSPGGEPFAGATSVTTGGDRGCVIRDGSLHCFGNNQFFQTSLNLGGAFPTPTLFTAPPNKGVPDNAYDHVMAGIWHTCATYTDGSVCFGDNSVGQLGDPILDGSVHFTQGSRPAVSATGALTTFLVVRDPNQQVDDSLFGFGANLLGILGYPPFTPQAGEVIVSGVAAHPTPVQIVF